MHTVLALLTTTWLETHQVHSTFRFEFARSMLLFALTLQIQSGSAVHLVSADHTLVRNSPSAQHFPL